MFPVNLNPRAYEASMISFLILQADRHIPCLIHKQMLEVTLILMTIIRKELKLLYVSFSFL